MPTEKPWGETQTLYLDDKIEVCRIWVRQGAYCTRHLHKDKDNAFWIVSGRLRVVTYHPDGTVLIDRILEPGGSTRLTIVGSGLKHRFEALTDVVAHEVYQAIPGRSINKDDIVRFDEGMNGP
jgi:mannose-6-phosphate isomerase-like protein (cupin superfamily)